MSFFYTPVIACNPRPPCVHCRFLDEPLPKDGYVDLTDKPGFGVTLNKEGVKLTRPYVRLARTFEEIEAEKTARTPDQADWLKKAAAIPAPPHA